MLGKLMKKFCDRLFYLLLSDNDFINIILKQYFPNAIELEYKDFIILNTPPLCYDKQARQKALESIIKRNLSLK